MAFPLTAEQQNIVRDRGGELLVSAAAGSGKTRVLVERLLDRVTGEGLDIDRFLVITYTKAAAAELRERIAQELTDRLAQDPGDRHLRRQTTLVYQAQISTIHSFCSTLLRENGYLLDLDPDFRLCDEVEGKVLMAQTLESLIDSRYEGIIPDSPFAQLADTLGAGRDDSRLVEIVLDIYTRVQSHPDPRRWLTEQRRLWELEDVGDMTDTLWGQVLMEEVRAQSEACLGLLAPCQGYIDGDELLSQNYSDSLRATIFALEELTRAKTWDEVWNRLPVPFPRVGTKRKRKVEIPMWQEEQAARRGEEFKRLRDRCRAIMEKVGEYISDSSDQTLEELRLSTPVMQGLIDLVLDFLDAYAAEKARRSLLDFSDQEHFAVKLLLEETGEHTELARSWSQRFDEVLVDEYQDTNQVQNAIFRAVSDNGRKLVEVGDVKQSIYRFRLADPTIFIDKYNRFTDGEGAETGQPRRRTLSRNFRSREQVLEGCNDLFRAVMSTRLGELEYTADQALVPGAKFPDAHDCALEVDILDLDHDGEEDEAFAPGRDLLEARFAAKRIRELLDKPFQVADGGALRPLRPSDVMILMRSPGSSAHQYVRALGEQGIPCAAEGGEDFFQTPEIYGALSILQIVDNPRQDVPLIGALRSPVFDFSADQLAMIRSKGEEDYYSALCTAAAQGDLNCAAFLEELGTLRSGSQDMTTGELVWHIYEKLNLLGIFGAMERGAARQENLLRLYTLAKEMEGTGCQTLFQFLTRLERLRESGGALRTSSAPEGEGVTIMSIHRSKGLEKPVVLLCGLTRRMNKTDLRVPVLFHPTLGVGPKGLDQERRVEYTTAARSAVGCVLEREMLSEELRLLYVAMTRAKDKLIMSLALKDAAKTVEELSVLTSAKPSATVLTQLQTVGHWVLLHTLSRREAGSCPELKALLHGREGEVFGPAWDIRWHYRGAFENVGRTVIFGKAVKGWDDAHQEELEKALSWRYPTPGATNTPSKLTATQIKGREKDEEIQSEAQAAPGPRTPIYRPDFIARTRGLTPAQRGSALHLVMENLDLRGDLSREGIRTQIERLVEGEYLSELQRDAVPVDQLARFFDSELGKKVTSAETCQREFKFSILTDAQPYFGDVAGEQLLLQGVVDLWFQDGDGITVVDFKSDRVEPGAEGEKAEEYRPQLETYRLALRRIFRTDRVRTVLWFFRTARAVEV